MRRLLWIGSPFFSAALAGCGWQNVVVHNFEEPRVFFWNDLVALAGFTPDVLVVADKSRPPFVLGMEDFPCLTVFYSVDSHIHSWQPLYAQGFDLCLVSLRDHLSRFAGPFLTEKRVFWSPPFAGDALRPTGGSVTKVWDCLFVGTVNENTPKRAAFLKKMTANLPGMYATRGDFQKLFPQGRVLLNQCEHGDLNFRVFEAMGMGGALVTPRVGHGLEELFTDGVELALYAAGDADDACDRIRTLLAEPDRRKTMEKAALAAIDREHRAAHRAAAFTRHVMALCGEAPGAIIGQRQIQAAERRERCLKLPYLLWAKELPGEGMRSAYLAAATGRFSANGPTL